MRFAVLSDIHGNLEAFQAVLADMESLGIEKIVNLGDVIGYGPDPEECVALVRELSIPTVLGNHEHAMLREVHKRWFNKSALKAVEITESLISDDTKAWCHTLPASIAFDTFRFVHGYPPDNSHLYLFNTTDDRVAKTMESMVEDVCFVGHTHDLGWVSWDGKVVERGALGPGIFVLEEGRRYLLNIGSVGQPRDDFDNLAKYAVFDSEERTCEIRGLSYDFKSVYEKIMARGIPETYGLRLLWRA